MKRIVFFAVFSALFALPLTAFAQSDPRTAQQELIDLVGKTIVEETTRRSEEVRKAKEVLDVILRQGGTAEEQAEAERDVEEAEARYAKAQKKLDTARLDAFAAECGTSASRIRAMRNSGMGWGRIAKECGAHPSIAGKGKGKGKDRGKGKKMKKNKGKGWKK